MYLVCRLLLEKKNEVITFLISMQISISSLQTHNVNRCGRSRHLARKLSLRRKQHSKFFCYGSNRNQNSTLFPYTTLFRSKTDPGVLPDEEVREKAGSRYGRP